MQQRIYTFFSVMVLAIQTLNAGTKVIMLDPAGHTKNTGRQLNQSFERAETYKCATALKDALEKRYDVRVILSRAPGEELVPLQSASFANRLNVDLFMRIHFFKETADKPTVHFYHHIIDPTIDKIKQSTQSFIPIDQAHCSNAQRSFDYAKKLHAVFCQPAYQQLVTTYDVIGLPLKPLAGIIAPALVMEVGLHNDDQWQQLLPPLIEAFQTVIIA